MEPAFVEEEGNYQDFYPSPVLQSPARAPGAALAAREGQKPQSIQGQGNIKGENGVCGRERHHQAQCMIVSNSFESAYLDKNRLDM